MANDDLRRTFTRPSSPLVKNTVSPQLGRFNDLVAAGVALREAKHTTEHDISESV